MATTMLLRKVSNLRLQVRPKSSLRSVLLMWSPSVQLALASWPSAPSGLSVTGHRSTSGFQAASQETGVPACLRSSGTPRHDGVPHQPLVYWTSSLVVVVGGVSSAVQIGLLVQWRCSWLMHLFLLTKGLSSLSPGIFSSCCTRSISQASFKHSKIQLRLQGKARIRAFFGSNATGLSIPCCAELPFPDICTPAGLPGPAVWGLHIRPPGFSQLAGCTDQGSCDMHM